MLPVIELDRLTVELRGRTILDDLSRPLSGRSIGLLGPNGAGKSTLINTPLGFRAPASGTAQIFGTDIRQAKALRRHIGYMPETDAFISHMSGVRFVRYMAELAGLPPEPALERAHEAFFYVGLGEARYRKLGTYSLGMKQLTKLAQAIAHGPRLQLLDEPTNGLDPPARQRMAGVQRARADDPRPLQHTDDPPDRASGPLALDAQDLLGDLGADRPAPATVLAILGKERLEASWCSRRRPLCASCSAWPPSTTCRSGARTTAATRSRTSSSPP